MSVIKVVVLCVTLGAPAAGHSQARSAPITNVRYDVAFMAANGVDRSLDVAMTFSVAGRDPVLLSLPVWTPGSYEVSNYARFVSHFSAAARGTELAWDKLDPDTWRVQIAAPGEVTVRFRYRADTLDNAMSWVRDDFALFNGTNLFLYPEGRPLDFPSSVTVRTEGGWRVTTGLTAAGASAWNAQNYHELVDHPFFVGRFDVDSAVLGGVWFRLSAYPAGTATAGRRAKLFDQLGRAVPKEMDVFRDVPWKRYELMQIADSAFGGMSALEHENSNVAIIGTPLLDENFVPSVYAHEIFHAFNVKRLRPSDLWPYRYDAAQPTPWLWVSEGITDYYADLALARGGVTSETGFLGTTHGKMDHVEQTDPIALEDASLQAWLHMTDGTGDIYYDKGSLAGLALDILIRDASDNASSLDLVMRELYAVDYRNGRGFTPEEWWGAVSRAARGASFADFNARYVNGRATYPWSEWLPKAGWRLRSDTTREPRLGLRFEADTAGLRVVAIDPAGVAAAAGIQPGDVITAVDGVSAADPAWQAWRQKFSGREGAAFVIALRRAGSQMSVTATNRLATLINSRIEVDPAASPKARRIRDGILKGITGN